MLIVMRADATDGDVERVVEHIRGLGRTPVLAPGTERVCIGMLGEERGLKAPPRNRRTPNPYNTSASSIVCARLSTEHGPAMKATPGPPMACVPTGTTVSAGRKSRLANL